MSEHVKMFIGGAWVDAEDGATFDATSPSTGAVIGSVPEGSRADAQRAIDAANAAAPAWAALSAFDRAAATTSRTRSRSIKASRSWPRRVTRSKS